MGYRDEYDIVLKNVPAAGNPDFIGRLKFLVNQFCGVYHFSGFLVFFRTYLYASCTKKPEAVNLPPACKSTLLFFSDRYLTDLLQLHQHAQSVQQLGCM